MKKIILATRNRGKIAEINQLFSGTGVEFVGLDAFPGVPEAIEDGNTFQENALKKAQTVFDHTRIPVLSEDSGLAVDILGGAPGVYSARYASALATDRENIGKLLSDLHGVSPEKRTARFISVFCLYDGRETLYFEGEVQGHLLDVPRGTSGFGYDPLFVPRGYDKTFAELGTEEKNRISHRANAIRKLKGYLLSLRNGEHSS
ncbi:MAG: RdgB/HAM1 family non-canonical purine NTP pyrophosphatase [bacterium]